MKKALIIIDMQPYYDHNGAVSKIIDNCRREINKAIQENIKIVFVEWEGVGSTDIRLRELVDNYQNVSIVQKDDDNGSQPIINMIGSSYNLIKVCGVNTDCCVIATVKGLLGLCYNLNIEVIGDAVNSCWYNDHLTALMKMKTLPRTKVIG